MQIGRRVMLSAMALAAGSPLRALAQGSSDGAIRLVVPFAAGGGVDAFARPFAKELSGELRQSVIVENKPSTTGSIGAADVAKSAPDGRTLLISSAAFGVTPSFVPKLPYDIFKDFDPITILVAQPQVLVAPVGFPAGNLADVLRLARGGRTINFALPGSTGIQRLATELLSAQSGITFNNVSYKGAGAAFTDLIGGQVDLMFDNPGSSMVHVNSGRLKVLATTGAQRLSSLPQVGTVAEAIPGFEALNWFVLAAPAGTPVAMLDRLNAASVKMLQSDSLRQLMERDGIQPIGNSREQAAAFLRSEFAKWDRIIRERNLKGE